MPPAQSGLPRNVKGPPARRKALATGQSKESWAKTPGPQGLRRVWFTSQNISERHTGKMQEVVFNLRYNMV